ncbi:MAG: hypothetical protein Q8L87_05595 [Anaerolineales bacterium]|jgi:hypothetical protein|nr:hypothetical protein [Anaerolineales bacterium]
MPQKSVPQKKILTPDTQISLERYKQYWEMLRWHTSASWNIPALSLLLVTGVLGLKLDSIQNIKENLVLYFFAALVISIFLFIMYAHHKRNMIWVREFEKALIRIEQEDFKTDTDVYHSKKQKTLKGIDRLSSSTLLSGFLITLSIVFLILSIIFAVILFT